MSDLTRKEKAKAMRNGQMKMEREGCDWSIEDDIVLREMFGEGEDVLDMALMLERKEPAIQQRIDQLNLYSKQNVPARRRRFPPTHPGAYANTARWTDHSVPAAPIIKKTRRKYDV